MVRSVLAAVSVMLAPVTMLAGTVFETGFSYQGRLTDGGQPASGLYDFTFELYDAEGPDGSPISEVAAEAFAVQVDGGLFTAWVDFGFRPYAGTETWLEVHVSPAGEFTFTTLPRQRLLPVPGAMQADDARSLGDGLVTTSPVGSSAPKVTVAGNLELVDGGSGVSTLQLTGGDLEISVNGATRVTIASDGTISLQGSRVEVSAPEVVIAGADSLSLEGGAVTITATSSLALTGALVEVTASTVDINGAAAVDVDGGLVTLN